MSSRQQKGSAIAELPAAAIGADLELALLHMPGDVREAFAALFAVDIAMGDVVARAREPQLARIKLAWWREQLEALDRGPPPAEPRLQAVARHVLPLGISGADVGELEPGWATLLDEPPDPSLVAARGAALFRIGGTMLRADDPRLAEAGSLYALASVGRRGLPQMLDAARSHASALRDHRFQRRIRSLTMLARGAARDPDRQESEGSRGRVLAMLAHRWSGRIG